MHPVLRIRILSDRHNFYVFGSISTKSTGKEKLTFFSIQVQFTVKVLKIMTPMTLPRKKKTFQIDTAVDKNIFKKNDFPNLSRIRIQIWIGMKMERGSASPHHMHPPRNFFL
jgi:hypothetical protein